MKLHLSGGSTLNAFTGYGAGFVAVNKVRYERSLILTPDRVLEDVLPALFTELDERHFESIAALNPAIVLLGTGSSLRFPAPSLTRSLTRIQAGLEVMDTSAACRTYNILSAEGRNVVAAILLA